MNIDGVKPGFNTIRSTIPTNETIHVELDPTSNAPIAVFDGQTQRSSSNNLIELSSLLECDIHIPTNQKTGKLIFFFASF